MRRSRFSLHAAVFLAFWTAHCGNELVAAVPPDGWYDYSAYTDEDDGEDDEAQSHWTTNVSFPQDQPEPALYNGGILKFSNSDDPTGCQTTETGVFSPAFVVYNLNKTTMYTFSCWVKLEGANSALITARLAPDNAGARCIGTVLARNDCWAFLKGGFVLDWPTRSSVIFFQNADKTTMKITVASGSLQPFTTDQWSMHQKDTIRKRRKRMATIHVADLQGARVVGASVSVQQTAKDFPFGSAIASTILGNQAYQKWFVDRFNAAVFEDELKWYSTEPMSGLLRFDVPDKMLAFVRSHRVMVRGHNIFWENQDATPRWVKNLTADDLRSAVNSRIQNLMARYRGEFAHWDVNNEMLHYNFYEQRLGPNASVELFSVAQDADPLATLFMNEYNVVETCDDVSSTVDTYVARLKGLRAGGAILEGVGLEGHFSKPNIPLMRAVLDKLATLGLPIWFTEIDISNKFDAQTQAVYLEQVLREAHSHPAVSGIMLWTALHQNGCYQMCLTDWHLKNLPAGDVVDRLLQEWQTGQAAGRTDAHGAFSFSGFLGEYVVSVSYGNSSSQATFSLSPGDETRHINLQI